MLRLTHTSNTRCRQGNPQANVKPSETCQQTWKNESGPQKVHPKTLNFGAHFLKSIPSHFNNCQKKHLKFNSKSPWKVTFPKEEVFYHASFSGQDFGLCSRTGLYQSPGGKGWRTWLFRVFGDEILPSYVGNSSLTIVKLTLKKAKKKKKQGLTSFYFKNCDFLNAFFSCSLCLIKRFLSLKNQRCTCFTWLRTREINFQVTTNQNDGMNETWVMRGSAADFLKLLSKPL